jgi:biotin carboxylase
VEPLLESVARQRARLGVQGLSPEAAHRFRDKGAMKAALRAAGVPVAPSRRVQSLAEAHAFALEAGFPLVLKPPAGVSAAATVRVDSLEGLAHAWSRLPRPLLAEGFLTGTEHSLEAFVCGGQIVFHSVTRYAATPLAVTEDERLQWVVILPRVLTPFEGPLRVIARAL